MSVELSIKGLQQAQQAHLKIIAALKPKGAVARAILYAATQAHRHAVASTPHDYGALRAAHRISRRGTRGEAMARIYISPSAIAPRRKTRPAEYGAYLHQQGMIPGLRSGIRAFYQYTVETYGKKIVDGAIARIIAELP